MAITDKKLTVAEAAKLYSVHPKTIRRWIAEGRIRAERVGPRLIRIDAEELRKLIEPLGGSAP